MPIPPATSEPVTDPGVGFVTFPISLIPHKGLTDFDVRLLLLLDHMGWLEGPRDGVVRATNEAIAERMGKSPSAVSKSLRHVARIRPPLIRIQMFTHNRRDGIHLIYDRYGEAAMDTKILPIASTEHGSRTEGTTPLQPGEAVAIEDSQDMIGRSGGYAASPQKRTMIPISDIDHHHHQEGAIGRFVLDHSDPTGPEYPPVPRPATLPDLIAWIPSITDDEGERSRLVRKARPWVERIRARRPEVTTPVAIEWVQDALTAACDKGDMVSYANHVLLRWVTLGGRPAVELAPAPEPAEASPPPASPPANGFHPAAPRPSQAQRAAAERERIREGFRLNKIRKEAADAQGA